MATELEELVEFLNDRRPEVKQGAAQIVEGLTGSADGVEKLKGQTQKLTKALFRLLGDSDPAVSKSALVSLVNLSQDPAVAEALLDLNVVGRVMDYLREKTSPHVQLLVMLLANITVMERGCQDLLQLGSEGLEGLNMAVLLKLFTMSALTLSPGELDAYEHTAAVLTNVTRLKQGRALLLQPGRGLLQALAAQLSSESTVRKQGCSSALRNCCLAAEEDGTVELLTSDTAVLERMLVPINGQEPLEKDDLVREALAECIHVLARLPVGREALRAVNAPDILSKGYEFEEHPGVCQAMEHASRCFLFDTGDVELEPEEEGGKLCAR